MGVTRTSDGRLRGLMREMANPQVPPDCEMWVEADDEGAVIDRAGCTRCRATPRSGDALLCARPGWYASAPSDVQVMACAALIQEAHLRRQGEED